MKSDSNVPPLKNGMAGGYRAPRLLRPSSVIERLHSGPRGPVRETLVRLYGSRREIIKQSIVRLLYHLEGGELYSQTLREIFRRHYGVEIGAYSHGGCFVPHQVGPWTTIGRYCSLARDLKVLTRDHPLSHKSTHAFFYNPVLGFCTCPPLRCEPKTIGNDVHVGSYAVILPGAKHIGDGAVIGAGAVVNKDVPPYAVVLGNPARVVRYRFPQPIIEEILASRWWEKSIGELKLELDQFQRPYPQPGTTPLSFEEKSDSK